jgi:membrane-associated phospholipid phosphatase
MTSDVVVARRWLLGIVGGASLALVAVYGIAVRTRWGQRLDNAALRGRRLFSAHDVRVAQALHTRIDIASVALLGGGIVLVALLRGRAQLATGVGAIIVGSFATAELLKRVVGRPRFLAGDSFNHAATFPSGHTTIATALAVGALFVAPRRFRAITAAIGSIFAAVIGCSMIVTASHRPSDVIGAVLIVTAWSAAVAAILLKAHPSATRPRPLWTRSSPWMLLAGAALLGVAFASAVVVALAIHHGRLDTVELGRAFAGAAFAIFGTTTTCVATLMFALHDVELDKPGRRAARPALRDIELDGDVGVGPSRPRHPLPRA